MLQSGDSFVFDDSDHDKVNSGKIDALSAFLTTIMSHMPLHRGVNGLKMC